MEFKDLLVDHDYYCSESNYYAGDAGEKWETFQDFFDEYHDADVDMNLIFRWDIKEHYEEDMGGFYMEIFMMKQRKGIFQPHFIRNVSEADFENIKTILQPHLDKLAKIWLPFTSSKIS